MLEAQASAARAMPPRPNLALSDVDLESSRDTSSVDSQSVVDAAHGVGYFNHPRASNRGPPFIQIPHGIRPPPQYADQEPWSPERRRSSLPDDRAFGSSWPRDGPTPTAYTAPHPPPPPLPSGHAHHHPPYPRHQHHHHVRPHHPRIPSDISITSSDTSDTSSITTSSASMSPIRYQTQLQHSSPSASGPSSSSYNPRRHSASVPPPISQKNHHHYYSSSSHQRQPPPSTTITTSPSKPKNVRWEDDLEFDDVPARPTIPRNRSMDLRGRAEPRTEYEYRGGEEMKNHHQRRGARSVGPITGVGGRRYAPNGSAMEWR